MKTYTVYPDQNYGNGDGIGLPATEIGIAHEGGMGCGKARARGVRRKWYMPHSLIRYRSLSKSSRM